MRRDELTKILRQVYTGKNSCGVARVEDAEFQNIWFVVPPPPPFERPGKLPIASLKRAHETLERLPFIDQTDEVEKLISYLFVRREAVQSSRMEGTWSTIDEVLTPRELWSEEDRGASKKSDRSSVLGYAKSIESEIATCLKRGVSAFDIDLVSRVHKNIMSKEPSYRGVPGQLREPRSAHPIVWIGGGGRVEDSVYNPVPPQYVLRSLKKVVDWMSDESVVELGDAGMGLSLPLRLAIGHSHFEAVHPFRDGNGRVGRVLMTLQMACSKKLPVYISGFIEAKKSDYISALAVAQKKLDYSPIIEFISEAIYSSANEADKTKSTIRRLPNEWMERGEFRKDSAAQRALSVILKYPIFTTKTLTSELDVSAPAIKRAVDQLVEKKIVRERTGFNRNRIFAAEEVLQILGREYGESIAQAQERGIQLLEGAARK